jgi:hypothetical protein
VLPYNSLSNGPHRPTQPSTKHIVSTLLHRLPPRPTALLYSLIQQSALPACPIMHTPSPMLHQQCTQTAAKRRVRCSTKEEKSPHQVQRTNSTTATATQHCTYQQHVSQLASTRAGASVHCNSTCAEAPAPTHILCGADYSSAPPYSMRVLLRSLQTHHATHHSNASFTCYAVLT